MIKKLVCDSSQDKESWKDMTWRINIENSIYDIDDKIVDEQIELWESSRNKEE